jgi:NAD(P)H dehydrogenase (quinone)
MCVPCRSQDRDRVVAVRLERLIGDIGRKYVLGNGVEQPVLVPEQYLAEIGTPFTSLRNGFYATTVPFILGQAFTTGEIVAPADGPVSWTTPSDLAEAAAIVLADPGRFEGATPPLTALDTFDLDDIADILTKLTGRTIRRTVADDDEWAVGLAAHGAPEAQATMLLGMFRAARRGEFSATSPTLGDLLGRPATPLSSFLEGVAAAH